MFYEYSTILHDVLGVAYEYSSQERTKKYYVVLRYGGYCVVDSYDLKPDEIIICSYLDGRKYEK